MGLKETVLMEIAKSLVPMLLDVAITNVPTLRAWLAAKCKETTNTLDDYVVEVSMDFLEEWLLEFKSKM